MEVNALFFNEPRSKSSVISGASVVNFYLVHSESLRFLCVLGGLSDLSVEAAAIVPLKVTVAESCLQRRMEAGVRFFPFRYHLRSSISAS